MDTTNNNLVTAMIVILIIIAGILLFGRQPFHYYRYQPAQALIETRHYPRTTTQTVVSYSRPSRPVHDSTYTTYTEYTYDYSYTAQPGCLATVCTGYNY